MSNRKIYRIKSSADERKELELVAQGKRGQLKIAAWKVQRANAMLMCDEGEFGPAWRDEDIAEAFSTTTRSLENWRKQAALDGPLSVLQRQKRVSTNNTHFLGSLYQAFGAEEAFRIMSRIELVHTPKHGSWLNMAEPELSVLTRQCFTDRVGDEQEVKRRSTAWKTDRNKRQKGIDWQFTNEKARVKLKRLYPKIEL